MEGDHGHLTDGGPRWTCRAGPGPSRSGTALTLPGDHPAARCVAPGPRRSPAPPAGLRWSAGAAPRAAPIPVWSTTVGPPPPTPPGLSPRRPAPPSSAPLHRHRPSQHPDRSRRRSPRSTSGFTRPCHPRPRAGPERPPAQVLGAHSRSPRCRSQPGAPPFCRDCQVPINRTTRPDPDRCPRTRFPRPAAPESVRGRCIWLRPGDGRTRRRWRRFGDSRNSGSETAPSRCSRTHRRSAVTASHQHPSSRAGRGCVAVTTAAGAVEPQPPRTVVGCGARPRDPQKCGDRQLRG